MMKEHDTLTKLNQLDCKHHHMAVCHKPLLRHVSTTVSTAFLC